MIWMTTCIINSKGSSLKDMYKYTGTTALTYSEHTKIVIIKKQQKILVTSSD